MIEENLNKIRALATRLQRRGQSLAQMALAWVLRRKEVTSVLVGASSVKQLDDNIADIKVIWIFDHRQNLDRNRTNFKE